MKVKSESEVAQSCLTPNDPMDCRLPGSSVHRIFQARVLEWGDTAFSITKLLLNLSFQHPKSLPVLLVCSFQNQLPQVCHKILQLLRIYLTNRAESCSSDTETQPCWEEVFLHRSNFHENNLDHFLNLTPALLHDAHIFPCLSTTLTFVSHTFRPSQHIILTHMHFSMPPRGGKKKSSNT